MIGADYAIADRPARPDRVVAATLRSSWRVQLARLLRWRCSAAPWPP